MQPFIDEPRFEQRAGERGPRFHPQFVHRELAEAAHRSREIDAADRRAGRGRGHCLDARPARSQHRARIQRGAPIRRMQDDHLARRAKQARSGRHAQLRIEDDARRRAHERHGTPYVEPRVIREDRADAGEHRRAASAPVVHVGARRVPRDPAALAVRERRATVEARGGLEAHPRAAAAHALQEAGVERRRFRVEQPARDRDTGCRKPRGTAPVDARVRIAHRVDHARKPRFDQGIGARGRAAVVAAGLERDIGRGAHRARAGLAQCADFGVRLTSAHMPALAYDGLPARDHAADARIRIRRFKPAFRKRERAAHRPLVECREAAHGLSSFAPRASPPGSSGSWSRFSSRLRR